MPKSAGSPTKIKKKVSVAVPLSKDHAPLERELLRRLYAHMLRCHIAQRVLARTARASNRMHPATGREAIEVGCAIDLRPEDVLLCPHNSLVAPLVAGVSMETVVGNRENSGIPESSAEQARSLFLPRAADSLAIAAGLGYSAKLTNRQSVTIALDAGTVPARAVDALALLSRDRLPVIAVIENRGGGSHPERLLASAREHKIPTITVDSTDVVAVYRVAREALHRARTNRGSTVIDCYPLPAINGHPTDAVSAMQAYMKRFNCWSEEWQDRMEKEYMAEVEVALANKV